jgi:hypothetical protein
MRYGLGVRSDKMAIFRVENAGYKKFSKDKTLRVVKAMKPSK